MQTLGRKRLSNRIIRKHAISMAYVDVPENLRSGDVMALWVGESEQEGQEQISAAANAIGVDWRPCQTAATAAAAVAKPLHVSGAVVTGS